VSGETGPIAEIANRVSKDIFKWFKWQRVPLHDQNFNCRKQDKHAPTKKQEHTHPVDVVFNYNDPYLDHPVLLNTDLKSYKKASITSSNIRSSLKSLAQTIDCARVSEEWRTRYDITGTAEIRGLLFVYNHDAEYDRDFSKLLMPPKGSRENEDADEAKGLTADSLPLEAGQLIHIIEPRTIAYMTTIVADAQRLHTEGSFPAVNYRFFYPDLKLHKVRGDKYTRPATIEMICAPFLIVEHDEIIKYDEATKINNVSYQQGFVIFYNRPGNTHLEFMYLFDVLSSYQILDGSSKLRIRVAHHSPNKEIRSNFIRAIEMYVHDWGFDDYKRERLENIELEIIEIQKSSFSKVEIGWERKVK